jgi:formamidopyrimidine-DNA glycosylase
VPELPEVETVRRGLADVLTGKRVTSVTVTGRRSVRRQRPTELVQRLEGRTVERADRRGKYLALVLDDGQVLVIHLRMSGQLLWSRDGSPSPALPHTHVVMELDDGSELAFVDPRTFGEWFVTDDVRSDGLPAFFDDLGPDPVADGLRAPRLRDVLSGRGSAVKVALTDQRVIAGIGNMYADEICFAARVLPTRRCATLTGEEVSRLAAAVRRILRHAIELRGSSLRDARYRDLMGELGDYQGRHRVYDRAGERCSRCGGTIERVKIGARSAYSCRGCQR